MDSVTRRNKKYFKKKKKKKKNRKWTPEKCPCKFCQTYIKNVGYI